MKRSGYYLKLNMDYKFEYIDGNLIYKKFCKEWREKQWDKNNLYYYFESEKRWKIFIQYLDLGIECTSVGKIDKYKIVDEKKWLLYKLKYGF